MDEPLRRDLDLLRLLLHPYSHPCLIRRSDPVRSTDTRQSSCPDDDPRRGPAVAAPGSILAALTGKAPAAPWPNCARQSKHPLAGRTILQIIPQLNSGGAERATIDDRRRPRRRRRAAARRERGRPHGERAAGQGRRFGCRFRRRRKIRSPCSINQRRLADLIHAEDVALVHARSRAPAWVAYGATRRRRDAFRHDVSRRLFRQFGAQAALQFDHGERRHR